MPRGHPVIHGYCIGHKQPPIYRVWSSMKKRCYNSNAQMFKHYGARGIIVCDRWLNSFENFLADMGPRPMGGTLERIDNNGNYEPANCKWASIVEQLRNRSITKLSENSADLIRKLRKAGFSRIELAEQFGVHPQTITRIVHGRRWAPINKTKKVEG